MNVLQKVFILTCLPAVASCASIIYAVDGGFSAPGGGPLNHLYAIDIAPGGTTTSTSLNVAITSLAEFSGVLYGIGTDGFLYSMTTSGEQTEIADLNSLSLGTAGGLTASTNGVLFATSGTSLYQISMAGDVLSTLALSSSVSGDLTFINGALYASGGSGTNQLETINPSTGTVTTVNTISPNIVTGLAYIPALHSGGSLYGLGTSSQGGVLLNINLATGQGLFSNSAPNFISDAAYDVVPSAPEPASFGLIGFGLFGLGIFTRGVTLKDRAQ